MLAIVDLQLKQTKELLEEQNIGLIVTPAARRHLAEIGYDPLYGARPLRRTIQRVIENPISSMIIKGEAEPEDSIEVDFDGNDFVFTVKKAPKVREEKKEVKKWRCLDCGQEFEAEEKQPCPACQSENVEEIKEEEPSKEVSEVKEPAEEKIQEEVEKLAEEAPSLEKPEENTSEPPPVTPIAQYYQPSEETQTETPEETQTKEEPKTNPSDQTLPTEGE